MAMATIRTLIADDEALARRAVSLRLSRERDFAVVGECASGDEVLAMIERAAPDLVFLDIQMPGLDVFALLQRIPRERRPAIVFVTAFDRHAIHAFDLHAVDYLLKPFDDTRFAETLRRVREGRALLARAQAAGLDAVAASASTSAAVAPIDRLVVRSRGRVTVLRLDAIEWIEAEGDYACLHAGGATHLVHRSLTDLARQLDPGRFARIHRSIIVNLDHVRELHTRDYRDYEVLMRDGARVRLSRTYRDVIEARLGERL
jgi:two-component system, LytTR family, response regulator